MRPGERFEKKMNAGGIRTRNPEPALAFPDQAVSSDDITSAPTAEGRPVPLPGRPGFDPWCLTDPAFRDRWRQDPRALTSIGELWRRDPDPRATLTIQAQIDQAHDAGAIGFSRHGHYFRCPWPPIYQARRAVVIGRTSLHQLQEFTFDVSCERIATGGAFRREILVASFHPTIKVDYRDDAGVVIDGEAGSGGSEECGK